MSQADFDSLSPEELRRSLLALYDSFPETVWQDEEKPSPLRVQKTVERFAPETEGDSRDILHALQSTGDSAAATATARWILEAYHEQPAFAALVEQAVASSKKAHMAPIPPELPYIAIGLLLMAFRFHHTGTAEKQTTTKNGTEKVTSSNDFSFDLLTAVKEGLPALANFLPSKLTGLFKSAANG